VVEIEFLDPGPEEFPAPEPPNHPGSGRAALRLGRTYAPALLWAAAAVQAVVAPFRVIDTITVRQQGQTQRESTDGWGRYRSLGASALSHGPRYGVILLACAAVLAAAAVLVVLQAVRRPALPALPRIRTALGVAGAGVLAALIAVLALNYLSTKDTLAAQVKSFGSSAPGTLISEVITAHVRFGGCMWLAVGALACALLAIPADLIAASTSSPAPPVADQDFAPAAESAPHPQDDLLESGPTA
jgi:hypothetical protein